MLVVLDRRNLLAARLSLEMENDFLDRKAPRTPFDILLVLVEEGEEEEDKEDKADVGIASGVGLDFVDFFNFVDFFSSKAGNGMSSVPASVITKSVTEGGRLSKLLVLLRDNILVRLLRAQEVSSVLPAVKEKEFFLESELVIRSNRSIRDKEFVTSKSKIDERA